MNQSLILHIVERLEGFVGKLPGSIQKPILHEVTPLKELFLQQRPPRFVLTGNSRLSLAEIAAAAFHAPEVALPGEAILAPKFRWQESPLGTHGTLAFLDAREAGDAALEQVRQELANAPADVFLFAIDAGNAPAVERELEQLAALVAWNDSKIPAEHRGAKVVVLHLDGTATEQSQIAISARPAVRDRLIGTFTILPATTPDSAVVINTEAQAFMALLARELPNEARVEMIRISRNRAAQKEVAQVLIKSTTAICTAIGAQPIPLADLPILTTLQLVMVSGIMYISGRERSLRAATEFMGAVGAGVGAGMVLREGTRAVLKFFPGWGNVVCGMVAGAGTYAIGRAATTYFLEGASLKDARRTFLQSRKKRNEIRLLETTPPAALPEHAAPSDHTA